jgi:hypothetical protein
VISQRVGTFPVKQVRLGVVLAVAAAAALFTWTVLRDDRHRQASASSPGPKVASVADLRALAGEVGHPVFWAGAQHEQTYELTRPRDGSIYIRYLPHGAPVGDQRPIFLTVGTYPHPNAISAVQKAAKRPGEDVWRLAGGGLAVSSPQRPSSVYFARPGFDVLVETYAESPRRARALVHSAQVRAIR